MNKGVGNTMNQVQQVVVTKGGRTAFTFICYDDFGKASYLAGGVMDRLCDYHGGDDWDYQVTSVPYVGAMTAPRELIELALSKVAV